MQQYKPTTVDEYLDMLDQAIYETDEIIACAGDEDFFDVADLTALLPIFEALAVELRRFAESIKNGNHHFANGKNLPFMPLVDQWKARIPFADILIMLNESHISGLSAGK